MVWPSRSHAASAGSVIPFGAIAAARAHVAHFVTSHTALHGHLLVEPVHGVLSLELLQLLGRVLVKELVDAEVTAAHADVDLVVVHSHVDFLGSELVDTL